MKIIKPQSGAFIEMTIHLIQSLFDDTIYDADVISAFIMNSLYKFSDDMITANPLDLKGQPCSAQQWQSIARVTKSMIEKYKS